MAVKSTASRTVKQSVEILQKARQERHQKRMMFKGGEKQNHNFQF